MINQDSVARANGHWWQLPDKHLYTAWVVWPDRWENIPLSPQDILLCIVPQCNLRFFAPYAREILRFIVPSAHSWRIFSWNWIE
jgi:hypothetical protein